MTFLLLCFFMMVFSGGFVALKYIVTVKGKLICVLVMLGCILGIVATIMSIESAPYNPKAAEEKRQQKQEEQWIQENFGNGKGEKIQQAIDDYKNN